MALIIKQLQGNEHAPTLKLEITPKAYNVAENKTPVDYKLTIERPYAVSSNISKSFTIKIGDKTISNNISIGGSGTKTLASGTVEIEHNADGTKKINCSFSMYVDITWNGVYNGTVSASANVTLPTIPRATQPSIPSGTHVMGSEITITMPRASTIFTHKLKLAWGSLVLVIAESVGISYKWQIPLLLAEYIKNSTQSTGKIWCDTYNGNTFVGSKGVSITCKVPDSAVPTIDRVTLSEANESVTIGEYVQSQSKLKVDVASSGIYGSTIKDVTTTLDGISYKGATITTEALFFSGTKQIRTVVTDSRGRKAETVTDVTVTQWYEPRIYKLEAERCDTSGNVKPDGECLKVSYLFDIASVGNKNGRKVVFEYAERGSDTFTKFHEITDAYSKDSYFISSSLFNVDKAYIVRIVVSDTYTEGMKAYVEVETEETTFDIHYTGQGMAFGKVAEETDLLDVGWNARFRKNVQFAQDTEWTYLTLDPAFKPYTDVAENTPKYRIRGKVVEIRGAVSPKANTQSSATKIPFATLPPLITPSDNLYQLCAGANKDTWTFGVNKDGTLSVAQYGGTAYGMMGANTRLLFQITYTLD